MRLPNGYGSVTKMSGKRRNPYMVRKTIGWHYDADKDKQVQDYIIIGYAKTKAEGLQMLSDFHAEPYDTKKAKQTFSEVWQAFELFKFGNDRRSSRYYSYHSAYRHCEPLYDKLFADLQRKDLQDVMDACSLSKASLENIKMLFNQLYKYAIMEDICVKDYSRYVTMPDAVDDEEGEPFSEDAIRKLWSVQDDPAAQIALMMIYSGLRISELGVVRIDLDAHTVQGGMKAKASRERVAPIHDSTYEFWCGFDQASYNASKYRDKEFYPLMSRIGYEYENGKKHTPHDCRHTFSWLADKYRMDEICKHMLMGHKLKGDTEQVKYRHRTLDELREALHLIKTPEA